MKPKTASAGRVTELEYGPTGLSDGVHGELQGGKTLNHLKC